MIIWSYDPCSNSTGAVAIEHPSTLMKSMFLWFCKRSTTESWLIPGKGPVTALFNRFNHRRFALRITIFGAVPSYFLKSSSEYEEPGVQCHLAVTGGEPSENHVVKETDDGSGIQLDPTPQIFHDIIGALCPSHLHWGSGSGQLWDVVVEKPSLSTTGIFYAKYSCHS